MRFSKNFLILGLAIVAFIVVVGAYIANFYGGGISKNSSDWNNLGSYLNGLLTPFLTFLNILVLMNIKNAVSDIGKLNTNHRNKLLQYNRNMDTELKIQINPDATTEDNLSAIEIQLASIQKLFDEFRKSDQRCMADLDELAQKANLSSKTIKKLHDVPYFENPFVDRMWELHNLGVNNTMSIMFLNFLQLKVNVFRLLCESNPAKKDVKEKLEKAINELEEFHKNTIYAD